MKKIRVTLTLAVTLFLFSLLIVSGCGDKGVGSAKGEDLLTFVPENAAGMLAVNFKKVAELEVFNKTIEDLKKKQPEPEEKGFKSYQDFIDQTGIDPQKDIHALVLAFFGDLKISGQSEPDFAAVLSLNYDKDKMLGLIKSKLAEEKEDLKEEKYQNLTIFKAKDEKGKNVAFSFISDRLIVVGRDIQVKLVIDLSKGKGKNIFNNKKVKPYLKEISGQMASFFFNFPEEGKKVHDAGMFKMDLSKAELFFGHVNYKGDAWTGEIQLVSHNPEGNEQLVTTLNGMKGMAAMGGPEIAELVGNINLSATADAIKISFSLSNELLKKMQKKIGAQKSGITPPPPEE